MGPRVKFVVAGEEKDDAPDAPEGPFVATFPAPGPPAADLKFKLYKPVTKVGGSLSARKARRRVVAGETERIEFEGKNYGDDAAKAAGYCRYIVGAYDPKTGEVQLKEAPTLPMYRTVKRLKVAKIIEGDASEQFAEARKTLGEAFGSKRAKTSLRAVERNEVDVERLQGVAGFITDQIEENIAEMPTKQEIKAAMDAERPIPPYNAQATKPSEVYSRDAIVPFEELKNVPVKTVMEANTKEQMIKCLPFQTSTFINDRIEETVAAAKKNVNILRELVYLAILMRFRKVRDKDVSADTLNKVLQNPPPVIINGLLERFTETMTSTKSQSHKVTPRMKDKATNFALALALRIDNYSVDPATVAGDMEIGPIKIAEHLRALGCRIEALSRSASEALGITVAEAKARRMRRAVLAVPLSFPAPKKRRKE